MLNVEDEGIVNLKDEALEGLDSTAMISVLECEIEARKGLVQALKNVFLKQNDEFTQQDEEIAKLNAQLKEHEDAIEAINAIEKVDDEDTLKLLKELEEYRKARIELSASLAKLREESDSVKKKKETNDETVKLLRENRARMIDEMDVMDKYAVTLQSQNDAKKKELAECQAKNKQLQDRSTALCKKKALQDEEVARNTRTVAQAQLDRTFHEHFPTLPKWEIAIDYFGCATVANPGWIYIGTEFCGWEPAINPFKSRGIIPISHITRLNKIHTVHALEPWLFELYCEAKVGADEETKRGEKIVDILPIPLQPKYTFRSAKWRDLFDTIKRQAQRYDHAVVLSINGTEY